VLYPAGEFGTSGGAQFYKNFSEGALGTAAFLEYDVMFEDGFDAVRGGKLPGLYGGGRSCSGGHPAEDNECFSVRLMWRADFNGVSYMYVPSRARQGHAAPRHAGPWPQP
jgi:hypothetical protein